MAKLITSIKNGLFALFSVDPRSLAFCRTCMGVLLLVTYINFMPYIDDYFSDDAIIGRKSWLDASNGFNFSLYLINGNPQFPELLLGLSMIAALGMIFGIYPRMSAALSILFMNSLTVSSGSMNFGLHYALNCMIFWMPFLPYSKIPRWVTARPVPPPFVSLSALGLGLTALTICIGAGLVKMRDLDFWFFTADALQQFASYYTNMNPLNLLVAQNPSLARFLTRSTWIIELLIVPVLFVPFKNHFWRVGGLLLATGFFLSASILIHVGLFPIVPLAAIYVFIPSYAWEWMLEHSATRALLTGFGASRLIDCGSSAIQRMHLKWCGACIARVTTVIFLGYFLINIWNNYSPKKLRIAPAYISKSYAGKLLTLSSLDRGWDFMYGGRMVNKFLIVEYLADGRSFYRVPTHVHYRWPMFNYEMNYANTVMNDKGNSDRLQRYVRTLCARGLASAQFHQGPEEVALYELRDKGNSLGSFTELDQTLIKSHIENLAPFIRYRCDRRERPSPVLAPLGDGPLNVAQFPIVSWKQDFGALELNRSVDGNPIRLGGVQYARGIGTHANSDIRVSIKGARRFSAIVGVDDERSGDSKASVVVEVLGDGRQLFRSPLLTGKSVPVKVELSVQGLSELALLAHSSSEGGSGQAIDDDHVSWAKIELE